MPRNKDLKRLVRARMSKTGESYTAARTKVIAGFELLQSKRDELPRRKHGNVPL